MNTVRNILSQVRHSRRTHALKHYRGEMSEDQLCSLAHIMKWRDSAIIERNSKRSLVVFSLPEMKIHGSFPSGVPDPALVRKLNEVIENHLKPSPCASTD